LDIGKITGRTEVLYPRNLNTNLLSKIELYTISVKDYKYSELLVIAPYSQFNVNAPFEIRECLPSRTFFE
jgi:hypothetical protein